MKFEAGSWKLVFFELCYFSVCVHVCVRVHCYSASHLSP